MCVEGKWHYQCWSFPASWEWPLAILQPYGNCSPALSNSAPRKRHRRKQPVIVMFKRPITLSTDCDTSSEKTNRNLLDLELDCWNIFCKILTTNASNNSSLYSSDELFLLLISMWISSQESNDNNNAVPASSREELLSAPTAELELFDRSCSTPAQLCQRKKARSASSPPPPYPTLPSRLIIMMLMMMIIETKRCRKRPNISKQAYEPLLSTNESSHGGGRRRKIRPGSILLLSACKCDRQSSAECWLLVS